MIQSPAAATSASAAPSLIGESVKFERGSWLMLNHRTVRCVRLLGLPAKLRCHSLHLRTLPR